jgi:hypothetical protein
LVKSPSVPLFQRGKVAKMVSREKNLRSDTTIRFSIPLFEKEGLGEILLRSEAEIVLRTWVPAH